MIKQRIYEIANNFTTEYKKVKRQRKSPLRYYLIIALLAVILIVIGNVSTNNFRSYQQEKQDSRQKSIQLDKSRLEKENLNKTLQEKDKQLQEQQRKIKELEVRKAERARLASIKPTTVQRVSVRRVSGGCEQYRSLVSKYSWNVNVALAVMKAESGCNYLAANWTDNHRVCKGSFGLFQISCHSGQVFEPANNIAIAYSKYQARGWQPWSVCTRGIVRCT